MKTRTFELFVEDGPRWAQWELELVGNNLYDVIVSSTVALIDQDGGEVMHMSIEQAMSHSGELLEKLEDVLSKFQINEVEKK